MGEAPNPALSFTVGPMETDAAQFADAGFATAEDFEPGHFDEPEDEERLAELMMRNPFPPELDSGSSTLSNQPPTHDDIQARLARLGEELQALALNDAARRLEMDELRQENQVQTTRLDTHDLTINDLKAMYANLTQDHNHTKIQLAEALTQFGDFIRYLGNTHQSSAAGTSRSAASIAHSAALNPMEFFTNSPRLSLNALPPRPSISALQPAGMQRPTFDSASHSGRPIHPIPNRPVTRRMASSMYPQAEASASTTRAKQPRAASATMQVVESSPKGKAARTTREKKARATSAKTEPLESSPKGKGRGRGKEKAQGKGKGMQRVKGEGIRKGRGKMVEDLDIENDEDIEDDEDEDIEDDEDEEIEDAEDE